MRGGTEGLVWDGMGWDGVGWLRVMGWLCGCCCCVAFASLASSASAFEILQGEVNGWGWVAIEGVRGERGSLLSGRSLGS